MSLVAEVGHCELCGHDPSRVRPGSVKWALHEHHIARGIHRGKAKGKRFASLALCFRCHMHRIHGGKEQWPEARQLAVLKRARPADYDLTAYNQLIGYGPERLSEEDVGEWER